MWFALLATSSLTLHRERGLIVRTRGLFLLCLMLLSSLSFSAALNEIRFGGSGVGAYNAYVELSGAPSESLDDLSIVGIYGHGNVGSVVRLNGKAFPASRGYFVIGTTADTNIPVKDFSVDYYDPQAQVLLVRGLSASVEPFVTDLDVDDDGVLDNPVPWTALVDSVARVDDPPVYAANTYGPSTRYAIYHAYKQDDTGPWVFWDDNDDFSYDCSDTPGAPNTKIMLPGDTGVVDSGLGFKVNITQNYASTPFQYTFARLDGRPGGTFSGDSAPSQDNTQITPDVMALECYYSFTPTPYVSGVTYTVEIPTAGLTGINDPEKLVVVKRHDSEDNWAPFATTLSEGVLSAAGLTSFSEYTVASEHQYNPLPVTVTSFRID